MSLSKTQQEGLACPPRKLSLLLPNARYSKDNVNNNNNGSLFSLVLLYSETLPK